MRQFWGTFLQLPPGGDLVFVEQDCCSLQQLTTEIEDFWGLLLGRGTHHLEDLKRQKKGQKNWGNFFSAFLILYIITPLNGLSGGEAIRIMICCAKVSAIRILKVIWPFEKQ